MVSHDSELGEGVPFQIAKVVRMIIEDYHGEA
jgi:hypothetical protein